MGWAAASSVLTLLLQLLLPQCGAVSIASSRPHLVRHAVQAISSHTASDFSGSQAVRRLEPSATSQLQHNGTHLERTVHAKWQCTFPKGDCFKVHAPMEGLPEQMDTCTEEKAVSALEVHMTIDLTCAKMDAGVNCKKVVNTKQFDPFILCNNDPLLIKAKCSIECRSGKWGRDKRPFEVCAFLFDTGGSFSMSDKTVETCNLEAACKSPYVEQNEMFCSGHNSTKKHQAHWLTEDHPWKHRENHGIEAPPPEAVEEVDAGRDWVPKFLPRKQSSFGLPQMLWLFAAFLFLLAGWIHLGREDCLPGPLQQLYEDLNDRFHSTVDFVKHSGRPTSWDRPRSRNPPTPATLPYQGPSAKFRAPGPSEYAAPDLRIAEAEAEDEAVEFTAASS